MKGTTTMGLSNVVVVSDVYAYLIFNVEWIVINSGLVILTQESVR
jgi:hypothetical protein